MNTRRRLIGIDFSGAADAGKAIWIAEARATPAGVRVTDLRSVADRFGERDRDAAIRALREFIADARSAVVGIDAPFSLPKDLIEGDDWREWCAGYAGRYADAEDLRERALERAGGKELKRRCERDAKTPFSAYNLRLYRQTHHLLAGVLAPLVAEQRACALPMQHRRDDLPDDTPWLLETCPASTIKRLASEDATVVASAYKGAKPAQAHARRRLASFLRERRLVEWDGELEETCAANAGGDAVDACLCAFAVRRAVARPESLHCESDADAAIEGRVYT